MDYKKVKDEERKRAADLFGTEEEPTQLAAKVCGFGMETKRGGLG